jgi:hypothetical protein
MKLQSLPTVLNARTIYVLPRSLSTYKSGQGIGIPDGVQVMKDSNPGSSDLWYRQKSGKMTPEGLKWLA